MDPPQTLSGYGWVQNVADQTVNSFNSLQLLNVLNQLSALYKDFDDDNLMALFNIDASTAKGQ